MEPNEGAYSLWVMKILLAREKKEITDRWRMQIAEVGL
jgi:hypothetical protein